MNTPLCSSLERLESRIAPAGIVQVTASGGTVKIVGDGLANDISLSIIAVGDLQIVGNNGTMIAFNGNSAASASVEDYTKDIVVTLGDGADVITFGAAGYYGNITVDGGAGASNITLNGPTVIPGILKLVGKDGADTLAINSPGADFQVERDFLIGLGEGGATSTFAAKRLLVGGKFTVNGGSGVENFDWNVTDFAAYSDVTIAPGKGADEIVLDASGDIGITGKLTIKGGDNAAVIPARFSLTAGGEMMVRGAVSATTGPGDSILTLGGDNRTELAGGLSIKTGNGHSVVTLKGATQFYLGKVSIAAGGPTDFIMKPTNFFLGGEFSFKGSSATDTFDLEGSGIITGKASVDLGDGAAQTLTFTGPGSAAIGVFGDISFKQGAKTGTSTTTIAGISAFKKFTVATGGSDDTVKLDNLFVRGATSINLGAGGDTFALETETILGNSEFEGSFKILLGDGADTSTIGDNNTNDRVKLDIPGTLDAGAGTDTVSDFDALGNIGTLTVLNVP